MMIRDVYIYINEESLSISEVTHLVARVCIPLSYYFVVHWMRRRRGERVNPPALPMNTPILDLESR
jgi:hypothetical protein